MSDSIQTSFSATKYKADGGFAMSGLVPFFGISAVAGIATGYLAGFISQWFYLVLLFPILIGGVVGAVGGWAIKIGKVRVPWLCGLAGFLVGTLACYSMYLCEYNRYEAQLEQVPELFREIARNLDKFQAQRDELPKELQEFIAELAKDEDARRALAVNGFADYMDLQARNGVEIGRATDVNKKGGMNLGYTGSYIYWGAELLIVACISFAIMKTSAAKPFCIHCDNWKTEESFGRLAGEQPSITEALETGQLSALEAGVPTPTGLTLSIHACAQCGAESTIDVGLTLTEINKKGESSTTQLLLVTYPGEAIETFRSIFTPDLTSNAESPTDAAFQQIEAQASKPIDGTSCRMTVLSDYGEVERYISEQATVQDIVEQMGSLDWSGFHQVILQRENGDLLEVGGSLDPEDGLSIIYNEGGEEFVTTTPPQTVDEMTRTLQLYLANDPTWKSQFGWE
jgi:hypothetical protein